MLHRKLSIFTLSFMILATKCFFLCDKECGKADIGSACNIKYGFCSPSCSSDSDCSKVRGATSLKLSCGEQGHCEPQDDLVSFLYGQSKSVDRANPPQPVIADNSQTNQVDTTQTSQAQEVYPNLEGITNWNLIETTWTLDPMSGYMQIPKNVKEAEQNGWLKLMDLNEPGSPGNVYINKYRDLSSLPVFKANGKITGYIMGVENIPEHIKANPAKYSFSQFTMKNPPYVMPDTFYGVTVLFRDPYSILSAGSSSDSVSQMIGNRLLIAANNFDCKLPTTFNFDVMAPLSDAEGHDEDLLHVMGFKKGPCFFQTGYHWFKQPAYSVDCNDIYPLFLLYNNNKLVGFGMILIDDGNLHTVNDGNDEFGRHWKRQWDIENSRLSGFFGYNLPQCMQGKTVSMQHVFLESPSQWECQDDGVLDDWNANKQAKKAWNVHGFIPGGTDSFLDGLGSH